MTNKSRIQAAITIFKTNLPEARGKFRAEVSPANANEVHLFNEAGLYCTINIRSQAVKGI